MIKYILIFLALLPMAKLTYAQDPTESIRPAALAFSERNPLTKDTYKRNANSYLAVAVTEAMFGKSSDPSSTNVPTQAKEFYAFTMGLFAAYSPEETLACLSWQTLDDVVKKHAELAVKSKDVQYPILTALVNLKFACMTEQEAIKINDSINKKQQSKKSSKQPSLRN